jgi:hypothetical protein
MVLVFKTNIDLHLEKQVRRLLTTFKEIIKIDFDFEDCDNILRIEAKKDIGEEVERTINSNGYFCRELV